MHGSAAGSGAPRGNKNAFKTGFHTEKAKAERKADQENIRTLLQQSHDLVEQVNKELHGVKRAD